MRGRQSTVTFLSATLGVWLLMTAILVVVPDQLDRWLPLEISRIAAWGVAGGLWIVTVDRQWQQRVGGATRALLQLVLWVGAALAAMWVSGLFRAGR